MNCKERVIRAIRHQESGCVPYHVQFTPDEREKMAAYYSDSSFEDKIGNHFAIIDFRPPKKQVRPGYFMDEFGVVWNRTEETAYKARMLPEGGGYICAPSHAVTRDVPAENVDAMLKVLMNQHKYIQKLRSY